MDMVAWMRTVSMGLLYLNTWSPASDSIWRGYGIFKKQNLAGERMFLVDLPLGFMDSIHCPFSLSTSCLWEWSSKLPDPATRLRFPGHDELNPSVTINQSKLPFSGFQPSRCITAAEKLIQWLRKLGGGKDGKAAKSLRLTHSARSERELSGDAQTPGSRWF